MINSYSVIETEFSGDCCYFYSTYNQQLEDLYKRDVLDTILEKRLLREADEVLKKADLSKEEFTRIALIFKKYSKVIFLVDYFEPLGTSLHEFLGFKNPRRCNIIFTYEIINSTIEDVLYSKYNISIDEIKRSVFIIPNTSSHYYNILRRLTKSEVAEYHDIILLTPKQKNNFDRQHDIILRRGFISSAAEYPEKVKLTYLI